MIALFAALAAAVAPAPATAPKAIAQVVQASGLRGDVMVVEADLVLFPPPVAAKERVDQGVWPWASVSKQVMAVLVMQQVEANRIALDAPADRYLPALGGGGLPAPTVRQLLQHRAGLPNPEDSPKDAAGIPDFYSSGPTGLAWCLKGRAPAGGAWRYNNCDTIVLGALVEKVTGTPLATLFAARIARPAGMSGTRYVVPGVRISWSMPAPDGGELTAFARYGAAGGLAGPVHDMVAFDRALVDGRLLGDAARAEMWKGDPALGYMALGQWVFSAPLKGCAVPRLIVERRGAIGRFQVRNLILPDTGLTVAVTTAQPDFDFGEIWQGKGFAYDLLSAAACG